MTLVWTAMEVLFGISSVQQKRRPSRRSNIRVRRYVPQDKARAYEVVEECIAGGIRSGAPRGNLIECLHAIRVASTVPDFERILIDGELPDC